VNSTRIHQVMNTRPTVINTTTVVRDAARLMTNAHFRHLPVASDADLVDGGSPVGRGRAHHLFITAGLSAPHDQATTGHWHCPLVDASTARPA
jgi:CBS domain-containing protein